MHPLSGIWNANIEKSRRHANHQFQSASLQFDVSSDAVIVTQSGVNMSGKPESSTLTFHPDGVEHPIAQAPGVVAVCRWVGSRMLESVGKKDGAVVGLGSYEVSEDGATLTAIVKGVDARGLPFDQAIVFDRS